MLGAKKGQWWFSPSQQQRTMQLLYCVPFPPRSPHPAPVGWGGESEEKGKTHGSG